MGRPSKGPGAKSKVVCVRLTPVQTELLAARFGSAGKALTALVEDALREEVTGRPGRKRLASGGVVKGRGKVVGEEGSAGFVIPDTMRGGLTFEDDDQEPVVEGQMDYNAPKVTPPPAPPHRHRRGPVIRVDYEYGTPKQIYGCSQCGEELA